MALTLPTTKLKPRHGSTVHFAPEGETIETVEVARGTKPAGSVLTDWEELGCLSNGEVEVVSSGGEVIECWDSTLRDWITEHTENTEATTRLNLTLRVQKVTPFILQMAAAAATVNGSTGAMVPGSKSGGAWQGWIRVKVQTRTDDVMLLTLWVEIRLANPMLINSKETGYEPEIIVTGLGSSLDAAVLGTVS